MNPVQRHYIRNQRTHVNGLLLHDAHRLGEGGVGEPGTQNGNFLGGNLALRQLRPRPLVYAEEYYRAALAGKINTGYRLRAGDVQNEVRANAGFFQNNRLDRKSVV